MRFLFLTKLLFALALFSGCSNYSKDIEKVLNKSGDNKGQLIKVLHHYSNPEDSLKHEAALYLISHMGKKFGKDYDPSSDYYSFSNTIDSIRHTRISDDDLNRFISQEWDKVKRNPESKLGETLFWDCQNITSDILIENIDYAFKAWQEKPWAKKMNFDDFCKWILPYRLHDEPLSKWRKYFWEEFQWLEDSLENPEDVLEAAKLVNLKISELYYFSDKLKVVPQLDPITLYKYPNGTCEHRYALIIAVMRSQGIPVSLDHCTLFARGPISHSWPVLHNDGIIMPFNGGESWTDFHNPSKPPLGGDTQQAVTIFRTTFEENKNSIGYTSTSKNVPSNLKFTFMRNVMSEYTGIEKGIISLKLENQGDAETAFLFGYNYGLGMTAVDWSDISSDGIVNFENIGKDGVFRIGYFNKGSITYENKPFYFPMIEEDKINYLDTEINGYEDVVLRRKYFPQYHFKLYTSWLKGCKIQASNDKEFKIATTLFEIDTSMTYVNEVNFENNAEYQYYRLLSNEEDLRLADLMLFNEKDSVSSLSGSAYGFNSSESSLDDANFKYAFDGNIRTNFNAPKGSWVAIDLGRKVKVTSAKYLARNNFNIVEPGDSYTLYYFQETWKELETKAADDFKIQFKNVPKNAMLLLKNNSRGREERIFRYENGNQIWH